jgi:hypothetical protein
MRDMRRSANTTRAARRRIYFTFVRALTITALPGRVSLNTNTRRLQYPPLVLHTPLDTTQGVSDVYSIFGGACGNHT